VWWIVGLGGRRRQATAGGVLWLVCGWRHRWGGFCGGALIVYGVVVVVVEAPLGGMTPIFVLGGLRTLRPGLGLGGVFVALAVVHIYAEFGRWYCRSSKAGFRLTAWWTP